MLTYDQINEQRREVTAALENLMAQAQAMRGAKAALDKLGQICLADDDARRAAEEEAKAEAELHDEHDYALPVAGCECSACMSARTEALTGEHGRVLPVDHDELAIAMNQKD